MPASLSPVVVAILASTIAVFLGQISGLVNPLAFAQINVVGGFLVTHRMLRMFKRKA